MADPETPEMVARADVELLFETLRQRYVNLDTATSTALVLALEGLKWLLGDDSAVTRDGLEAELTHWETFRGTA